MEERPTLPTSRRRLLQGFGVAAGGQFLPDGLVAGLLQGQSYVVEQGDRCVPVEPLSGRGSAVSFYDYETGQGSRGTTGLQREDTSLLFLYRGPNGLSLFVVHGKMGGGSDGGAATFGLSGLPADGEWVVRDDDYGGASQKDNWSVSDGASTIDWTWAGTLTDGGAFSGLGGEFEVRIEPRFNRRAELFGAYEGTVSSWELLSGDPRSPERVELDMTRPVTIRTGSCDGGRTLFGGSDDGDDPGRRRGQDGGKPGNDDPGPPGSEDDRGRRKERREERKEERKERRKERKEEERKERRKERKEEREERREDREEERDDREDREEERDDREDDGDDSMVEAALGDDGVEATVDLDGDDEDRDEDREDEGDD